jgi:hypothetical protein
LETTVESFAGQSLELFDDGGAEVSIAAESGSRTVEVLDNEQGVIALDNSATVHEGLGEVEVPVVLSIIDQGDDESAVGLDVSFSVILVGNLDFNSHEAQFALGDGRSITSRITLSDIDDLLIEFSIEKSTHWVELVIPSNSLVHLDLETRMFDVEVVDNDGPGVWTLSGSSFGNEGDSAVYHLGLEGLFGAEVTVAVQVNLIDAETDVGDRADLATLVQTSIVNRPELRFNQDTGELLFTATEDGSSLAPLTLRLPLLADGIAETPESYHVFLSPVSGPGSLESAISSTFSTVSTTILDFVEPVDGTLGPDLAGLSRYLDAPGSSGFDTAPVNVSYLTPPVEFAEALRAKLNDLQIPSATYHSYVSLDQIVVTVEVSASSAEELYFQIVAPDGSLSDRIPLAVEMLDDFDALLTHFKSFPNNVYRLMYHLEGEAEQPMLVLHIYEHQIVPATILDGEVQGVANQSPSGEPMAAEAQDDSSDDQAFAQPNENSLDPVPTLEFGAPRPLAAAALQAAVIISSAKRSDWKRTMMAALEGELPRLNVPSRRMFKSLRV